MDVIDFIQRQKERGMNREEVTKIIIKWTEDNDIPLSSIHVVFDSALLLNRVVDYVKDISIAVDEETFSLFDSDDCVFTDEISFKKIDDGIILYHSPKLPMKSWYPNFEGVRYIPRIDIIQKQKLYEYLYGVGVNEFIKNSEPDTFSLDLSKDELKSLLGEFREKSYGNDEYDAIDLINFLCLYFEEEHVKPVKRLVGDFGDIYEVSKTDTGYDFTFHLENLTMNSSNHKYVCSTLKLLQYYRSK